MIQRIREWLVVVLIAVLPFHAFLVTVGTKLIAGSGHAPLSILALWKEALLGVILMIAVVEIVRKLRMKNEELRIDVLDICIVGLLLWSFLQSIILHSSFVSAKAGAEAGFFILHYAFGFKYDFLPLVSLLLLRRVSWSPKFLHTAVAVLLGVGGIVAAYGIAAMYLPMSWFTWLGYSDLHSLYVPGGPLAAFQQIENIGIRRMQSTFSGPNQMGLWMLIPWSVLLVEILRKKAASFQLSVFSFLVFLSILLSFSRAAWIAAAAIGAFVAWRQLSRKQVRVAGCGLLVASVIGVMAFPQIILRATSSAGHIERPLQALRIMVEHPFGLGLGSAGPASNRFSDACVDLPVGADTSWAIPHTNLCVFVGGEQSQPTDRVCSCPLLPENWYLQIGVELGWIGFVLYLTLVALIWRLMKLRMKNEELKMTFFIHHSSFLIFLSISIAALFLHAWEDSAVAYTVWILLAVVLTPRQIRLSNP